MLVAATSQITFGVTTQRFLPLETTCPEPLSSDSFFCGEGHIPSRGKKPLSDHYCSF